MEKTEAVTAANAADQQPDPRDLIQAAIQRLKPKYVIHPSIMNELLYMGDTARGENMLSKAEQQLHRAAHFPGMPIPRYRFHWQDCSLSIVANELVKFRQSGKKLPQEVFKTMHRPTLGALALAGFDFDKMPEVLSDADIAVIAKAQATIEQLKQYHPELVSKKTGQHPKEVPFHIAKILADEYHHATNKKPTISFREKRLNSDLHGGESYGDFLNFVTAVFAALQIQASPEAMARKAIRFFNNREYRQTHAQEIAEQNLGSINVTIIHAPVEKSD